MAGGGLQHYENLPGEILTLAEVSEQLIENYPIVVRVVPKEYEIPTSQELPGDVEIVLEKPRWLQYVLVRILDFLDKEQVKKEKGENFVKERNAYVGQEMLIPVCYPGSFKLVNKPGRFSRYVSVSQIIKDLPRFIKINQEAEYTPPNQHYATTKLPAGTKLEVKSVQICGKVRYIKCKSLKRTYTFREDFPINCTALDDPDEYTLLSLAGQFVLLPKNVQFGSVWADDVVLKDDEEASKLLTLLGGPVKILKSFIRRNVYTAWMKHKGTHRQTVGLVPRRMWETQIVQPKTFPDDAKKQGYIRQHFGENLDSTFAVNGLYMLKPVETDVIWLIAPTTKTKDDEKPEDYEVIEKKLADYENVMLVDEKMVLVDSEKEREEEDDTEDYENPVPLSPPAPAVPPVPRRRPVSDEPMVLLPIAKPKKEDILKMIKEKARLGYDRVHEQLLKRAKQKQQYDEKNSLEHKTEKHSRSKSDSDWTLDSKVVEKKRISKSFSQTEEEDRRSKRLSIAYELNKDRPLPALPTKSVNKTDDDKLETYDQVEYKGTEMVFKETETELVAKKTDTLARFPDLCKIGKADQSKEDFFTYTVEELVECLKMCKMENFAIICSTNKLDGAFFRNFELEHLQSEPFSLSKLDIFKMRKIIEEGWRPKTDNAMK